jgi:hypothetical protein
MCWVLPLADPLDLGLVGGRTQNSFRFSCTTRPNKFGDPKALGSDSNFLGPASGPKTFIINIIINKLKIFLFIL